MKKLLLFGVLALSINVFAQSTVKIGNLEVMTEDLGEMKWEEAKKACKNLGDGWRLPSKDELNLLYKNKEKIGGFANSYYWSSTEYELNSLIWIQDFVNGNQYYDEIESSNDVNTVRAVRAINVFAQSNKLIIINSEVESGQTLGNILLPIKGVPYSVISKIIETSIPGVDFNSFDAGQKYQLMLNPQDSTLVSYTHSFSKENIIKVTLHPDLVIEKVLEMEGSKTLLNNSAKGICSLLDMYIQILNDAKEAVRLFKRYRTKNSREKILQIKRELDRLEAESDKYFEQRDGRTKADVESNIKIMQSCNSYNAFIDLNKNGGKDDLNFINNFDE